MCKQKLSAIAGMLALLASPLIAARSPGSVQACWTPAFKAGNADAVAQCYAPDAVLWMPGGPMLKGRDAIRAGYADFFAAATIKSVTLTEMGKNSHADEATSWGRFSIVTVSKKDGKQSTENGRYTDVSRKIGGHWQYVVDHASDEPAPAPHG